jgi:YtkA-like
MSMRSWCSPVGPLASLAFLCACSSSATPASSSDAGANDEPFVAPTPLTSIVSPGGLHLDVRTDPQPPPRGTFNVLLDVKDGSGAPMDGLTIDAVPWMTAMGHGSSVRTLVAPQGNGRYAISDVGMFMPGDWELRLTFRGTVSDHAAPIISVP